MEFLKNLLHGQGEKEIIGVGIYLRESVDTGCIRLMNGVALDKKKEGAGNRSEPTLWIGTNTFLSNLLCKTHLFFKGSLV